MLSKEFTPPHPLPVKFARLGLGFLVGSSAFFFAGRQVALEGATLFQCVCFYVPSVKHQERTGKDKPGATRSFKNPQILLSPSLVLSESLDPLLLSLSFSHTFLSLSVSVSFVLSLLKMSL